VDNQRNMILAVALSALVLIGWTALSDKFLPTARPPATKIEDGKTIALPAPGTPAPAAAAAKMQDRAKLIASTSRIAIRTPKLTGTINLTGARIDDLVLTAYRETIKKDSPPIRLLSPGGAADAYYAGFGWAGEGVELPGDATVWQAEGSALTPETPVTLRWANSTGQTFAIKLSVDASYMVTAEQSVANAGAAPVTVRSYTYLRRLGHSKDPDTWTNHVGPVGAVGGIVNYDVNFDNLDGKEPGFWGSLFGTKAKAGANLYSGAVNWLGFGDHYWVTAIAPSNPKNLEASHQASAGAYQADIATQPTAVKTSQRFATTNHLFFGAKEVKTLDGYQDSLGITHFGKAIDWGWFEVFEKPIFYYLSWLFKMVGNFGLAIILLTLTVRGLMFPIAQKQFASMAGMRAVQPKLKVLQERYKDDKPRLQQEMMALYKSEKINPLAGCLPILLQIPIFYALYKVLLLTIDMRHQPFVAWIKDLSAPDPLTPLNLFGLLDFTPPHFIALGILPILLGITMYLQFKLNPAPMDPAQAQVFAIMPWIFMFVMAPFAAGLQLYWVTSNLLTIAQQSWLYSRHPGMKVAAAKT
jgi:YidC/Oxa1 family membrane protein insertase